MSARIEIAKNSTQNEKQEVIPVRKYMQRRDAVMILNNMASRMQTYK